MKQGTEAKKLTESLKEREDLVRQARGVFGADATMQLFGAGGRIVAEDGRLLRFDSMAELRELMERERQEPPREDQTAIVNASWWYERAVTR